VIFHLHQSFEEKKHRLLNCEGAHDRPHLHSQ
jgi:hypothetical protein